MKALATPRRTARVGVEPEKSQKSSTASMKEMYINARMKYPQSPKSFPALIILKTREEKEGGGGEG
jgi:hypothetical protein